MARGRHRSAAVLRQQASLSSAARPRRRWLPPPWLAATIVIVVVLASFGVGYALRAGDCSGDPVVLSVVTSPDQQNVVRGLASSWEREKHSFDGHCGAIAVRGEESATVGQSLSPTQNGAATSQRVDVWMPDSSTWVTATAARSGMAKLFAYDRPSIATSPIVMAAPRPMADALGWPNRPISWMQLALQRIGGRTWKDYGHPEWGALRLGIGDPRQSMAALGTLLSVVDADTDTQVDENELHNALLLARADTLQKATSAAFVQTLRTSADPDGMLAASGPFPATEQQVAAYDVDNPAVPLTAIHPTEGTIFADYPYVTLAASWVDPVRQEIAGSFLELLQGRTGREAYGKAGFRDPERTTRYVQGFEPVQGMGSPAGDARPLPNDEAIVKTVVFWTALQRKANVLATVDTSGSMADPAPDRSGPRIKVVQEACIRAITLFSPESGVGLWKFSTDLKGKQDYQQLVPMGPVGGTLPGSTTPRRVALETAIRRDLKPHGWTALYNTIDAAYRQVQANYQPGRLNLLVLLTDGKNETPGGLTRPQLVARLRAAMKPDRPVQVIAIGFGAGADLRELREITSAVGGKAYSADSGSDIDQIFLSTLTGR
ncbi:substrate-binding domain-containing protein [Cryptosporangium phraense]|uniref:VWA domain-containing protein n=1 Tax=Cryptosporangium phraense TaxID=2593070 RepID=A0A545AFV0_9ACTN|nr:substrate-binding domain-containing protein [Cryptosporangium phraense]TQS40151.1 VWA domain-containing protein [Cryptosporangium phraense]